PAPSTAAGSFESPPPPPPPLLPAPTHRFKSFPPPTPNMEDPPRRPVETKKPSRHGTAHGGELDKMLGIGTDRGAQIEHDGLALERRPQSGNRRAVDPRHGSQVDLRHGHQRAGIAGGDGNIRLARLRRIDGEPHR